MASAAAASSPYHTIKTVWATIETFLDLQSTVSVSQTCLGLHREIVDADTQKIKVSGFSDSRYRYGSACPWERIPHYIPAALNAIHFPSLRRIDLEFNKIKSRNNVEGIEGMTSCFPLLVAHLASARNLESLHLSVGQVLDEDNAWRIEPLIELFGRNLARCKKLEDLRIYSVGIFCVDLMRDLVVALTPTIQNQSNLMCKFGFYISGPPDPESVSREQLNPLRKLDSAAIDFFDAILSCAGLSFLEICLAHSFSLSCALLEAAKQAQSTKTPSFSKLHHLTLILDLCMHAPPTLEGEGVQYLQSANILLENFSDCQQIQHVHLSLLSSIWTNNLKAVRGMLCNKPDLSSISLFFGGCDDSEENILQLVEDCIVNKEINNYEKASWQFQHLSRVNGNRLFNLMQNIKDAGGNFRGLDGMKSKSVEEEDTEEQVSDRIRIDLNHRDDVNEGDLPKKIDVEYWCMGK